MHFILFMVCKRINKSKRIHQHELGDVDVGHLKRTYSTLLCSGIAKIFKEAMLMLGVRHADADVGCQART